MTQQVRSPKSEVREPKARRRYLTVAELITMLEAFPPDVDVGFETAADPLAPLVSTRYLPRSNEVVLVLNAVEYGWE